MKLLTVDKNNCYSSHWVRQRLPSSFITPEKTGNSVQIKLNEFSPKKLEPCLEQTLELIYFPPTLFSTQKLNGGPVLLFEPLKCSLDISCYFLQTVLETSLYFPSYFRSLNPLLLFPLLSLDTERHANLQLKWVNLWGGKSLQQQLG